jgi:hypothetical protein
MIMDNAGYLLGIVGETEICDVLPVLAFLLKEDGKVVPVRTYGVPDEYNYILIRPDGQVEWDDAVFPNVKAFETSLREVILEIGKAKAGIKMVIQ